MSVPSMDAQGLLLKEHWFDMVSDLSVAKKILMAQLSQANQELAALRQEKAERIEADKKRADAPAKTVKAKGSSQ